MLNQANDYTECATGRVRRYWSFNRERQFIYGDGATDREALIECMHIANSLRE